MTATTLTPSPSPTSPTIAETVSLWPEIGYLLGTLGIIAAIGVVIMAVFVLLLGGWS